MTGYVSITPAKVHQLVAALQSASRGATEHETAFRDLLQQGYDLGAPLDVSELWPWGRPLPYVASTSHESSESYRRRVTHFEDMMRQAKAGIPVGDPQSWFEDLGPVDRAKVADAIKQAKMLAVLENFDPGARDKMKDTLRGMTPAEMDAMFAGLSDDEAKSFLGGMQGMPGMSWIPIQDRDLLNLIGGTVSQATVRRLSALDPTFNNYFRPSVAGTGYDKAHWDPATGTLFAGGPNMDDVDQQKVGDCGFQATLAAIAKEHPEFLTNMVKPNPNGSYTVTFKNKDGDPVDIVVQPETLVNPDGSTITGYGDSPDDPSQNELWAVIVEKAAAQWRGGYKDIQGRWPGDWMEEITGKPADRIEANTVTSTDDIQKLLDEGKSVTFSTQDPKSHPGMNNVKPKPIFGPHAYTVVKVEGDKVYLQNPWGSGEGLTVVSASDIHDYGTRVEAVDAS